MSETPSNSAKEVAARYAVAITPGIARAEAPSQDRLEETWRRTNLPFVTPGDGVNLERALRVGIEVEGALQQRIGRGYGGILE